MAIYMIPYYRNYDSSDTTSTGETYNSTHPLPTIEECGWTSPSGYQFKEWNTARDGTGFSFQPGDTIPSGDAGWDLPKYAIWEVAPIPYITTDTELTSVADAIRTKGGTSAPLEWPTDFVDAIDAIETGGGSPAILKSIIERTAVTSPTLPDDLTKIGNYVFYNYSNFALTSLPSGITSIGNYAFYGCTALALASLPSGMTYIGNFAFSECSNISLTSLPSGITTIGSSAFKNCTNIALTSLPSGVTSIGGSAFYNCPNVVLTSLPSGLTSVGNASFSGTGITSIVIPSGLTNITDAFKNCKHLTSISGNSVTAISGNGLSGCTSLVDARFPNYSSVLSANAFGNCNNLAVADIGSATSIYANAFLSCYKLQTLVLRKTGSICTLSNVSAFTSTPMRGYNSLTGTVYVPNALIPTYQTATNWRTLYDSGTLTFAAIEGSLYEL